MRKSRHTLFSVMMTTAALLFLISAAVSVILWVSVPLYGLGVKLLNIPETAGYSEEVCFRNYRALFRYLSIFGVSALEFPDFLMSETGAIHFREVRSIFLTVQIIAVTGLPVMWLGYREGRAMHCLDWLRSAAVLAASLTIAVIAGILIDRTQTFILFHKLFFTNSYWQLDPERDPVIRILTEEIFLGASILIFLLMAIGAWVYLRLRARGEEKRKKDGKALLSHGEKLHGKGHNKGSSPRGLRAEAHSGSALHHTAHT